MDHIYCAKAGRRIAVGVDCGTLSVCPKERKNCEIYRAFDSKAGPAAAESKKKAAPAGKKTGTKTCSLCKKEKPLSDFYKKKKAADGMGYWCKECFKKKQKEYEAKRKEQKQEKAAQAPAAEPDPAAGGPDPAPAEKIPEYDPPAGDPDPTPAENIPENDPPAGDPDPQDGNGFCLVLDFSGHRELFDRLQTAAAEDIRPLDMEVMYLIKKVFERAEKKAEGAFPLNPYRM